MLSQCLLVLLLLTPTRAASQGFYLLAPRTAQLLLTDLATGAQTPLGTGLPAPWEAPSDCTPTAIEQTGKWAYTFARPAGAAPGTPWSVAAMELRDGSVRKAYALPAAFPPALPACAHALAEDGGWHAYVAAVTQDSAPRLLLWRFTYTWPFSNESMALLDVPLAALGMGAAPRTLTLAVTNFTAWLALEGGLVGVDLATRLPSRRLPTARGAAVLGLQYDLAVTPRRVVAVLMDGPSTSLIAFTDTGMGVPEVHSVPAAARVAPGAAGWVALANDRGQLVVLEGGRALALALDSGAVAGNVSACSAGGCAIACVYEPFVFEGGKAR